MPHRYWLLLIVLTAVLAVSCQGPTPQATPSPRAPRDKATVDEQSPFGINALTYLHQRNEPDTEAHLRERLSQLNRAGARWDRLDFSWDVIEPEQDVWDFDYPDRAVALYDQQGVGILGVLTRRAAWAEQSPHTEQDIADFADYVYHMVDRYKGKIDRWEVWNEPNIPTSWQSPPHDGPNPDHYVAILTAAYEAAKRANPDCTVIGIASSMTDLNWLIDIAARGGLDYVDAVSFHPYSLSGGPEEMELPTQIDYVREVCRHFGKPDMPLYITELGWHAPYTSDRAMQRQGAFLIQSYVIALAQEVEQLYWFNIQSWRVAGREDWWESWGLFSPDGTPKRSFYAYQQMVNHLEGATFRGYLYLGDGIAYVFDKDDFSFAVAWAQLTQSSSIYLPQPAVVVDMYGERDFAAGGVVDLDEQPKYIIFADRVELPGLTDRRLPPANPVVNASFERNDGKQVRGWQRGDFYGHEHRDGVFQIVDHDAEDGKICLGLRDTEDAHWQSWPIPVLPGETITVTARIRALDATGQNGVAVSFLHGPGWQYLKDEESETVEGDTDDWQEVSVTATCPDDASTVRINLFSRANSGDVRFDDVRLIRHDARPTLRLTPDPTRVTLGEDQ